MKRRFASAGVAAPAFIPFGKTAQNFGFIAAHPEGVLLKPRLGWGSQAIRLVGPGDLDTAVGNPRSYMLEALTPGRLHHVDGLMIDGISRFSCASTYLTPPLAFACGPGGSYVLDQASDLARRLCETAASGVAALGPPYACAFHADIFEGPDGRLLCGEINCRTAGNRIRGAIRHAFGIDLQRAFLRSQLGLPAPLQPVARTSPSARWGWGSIRMRAGQLKREPNLASPPPGVLAVQFHARAGLVLDPPRGSADSLVSSS